MSAATRSRTSCGLAVLSIVSKCCAELGWEILLVQVETVAHGVERIVDLVGDSGGELAHRRQTRPL